MTPYDTFDYPSYWVGREYEHEAEVFALTSFLNKISKIETAIEVGVGYGRLVPYYIYRVNKLIAIDPSSKLLGIARKRLDSKKIRFVRARLENLPKILTKNTANLIIFVRVSHHIEDLDKSFKIFKRLLKRRGFLILEFANKSHLKAIFSEVLRGNFTFPLEIFPKELNGKSVCSTLPFKNYHPDDILEKLQKNGFSVVDIRSVSNIRSPILKKWLSKDLLIFFEKILQKPLARIFFGPSIFILARKIN